MPTTSTQVQWRRGTASQNAVFIGATGEITVDTDNHRVIVHDNSTAGGWTGARMLDLYQIQSGILYNSSIVYQTGTQNISGTKYFSDVTGNLALDINNRIGVDSQGYTSIKWGLRYLFDDNNQSSLDWKNRTTIDNGGINSINWDSRFLIDNSNINSLDYKNRYTLDSFGSNSIDWSNRLLIYGGQPVFDWKNGVIYDNNVVFGQVQSVYTNNRYLSDTGNKLTLDWNNKQLSGKWHLQSGKFTETFELSPSVINSSINLSNSPVYINNSSSSINLTLPKISTCTGRIYFIKNRGGSITLTGFYGDYLFDAQQVINYQIPSGYANIVINDSQYWSIM